MQNTSAAVENHTAHALTSFVDKLERAPSSILISSIYMLITSYQDTPSLALCTTQQPRSELPPKKLIPQLLQRANCFTNCFDLTNSLTKAHTDPGSSSRPPEVGVCHQTKPIWMGPLSSSQAGELHHPLWPTSNDMFNIVLLESPLLVI